LATLGRAAAALGKSLSVEFTERKPQRRPARASRSATVTSPASTRQSSPRSKST
jgi:hypothetical protein